jgi:elongation factor Ts
MRFRGFKPLLRFPSGLPCAAYAGELAYAELRKRGLAAAGKKAGRTAADGLVGVKVSECGTFAAVVEINSETDFVSRNEQFQTLVAAAAAAVVKEALSVGVGMGEPGSAFEVPADRLEAVPMSAVGGCVQVEST